MTCHSSKGPTPRPAAYHREKRPELRPYQLRAIGVAQQKRRGILRMATGVGKSLTIAGLTDAVPGRWLALVPRRVLRKQLRETLEQYGVGSRVQVATWQSVYARAAATADEQFDAFRVDRAHLFARAVRIAHPDIVGVVVDEVHTSASACFRQVLEALSPEYRIGLSATPLLRPDDGNAWIERFFGPVIFTLDAREAVEAGTLSKPRIRFVAGPDPLPGTVGYERTIVAHDARNDLIARLARDATAPVLILVNQVRHGRELRDSLFLQPVGGMHDDVLESIAALREQLGDRKIPSPLADVAFVHQETPDRERDQAIADLREGKLRILIATTIFDVGVDIPELRTVIVASGGRSAIACIQRLGRGLRLAPEKTSCTLIDIADVGSPKLLANTRARADAYAMAGFDVQLDVPLEPPVTIREPTAQPRTAPDYSSLLSPSQPVGRPIPPLALLSPAPRSASRTQIARPPQRDAFTTFARTFMAVAAVTVALLWLASMVQTVIR